MILDPKNPIPDSEAIIIDILSRLPRLTVKELHDKFLKKSNKKLTLQGLYYLLGNLQKKRIIVKDGKQFSIDAGWVHAVMDLADRLKNTYLQSKFAVANILVDEGESSSFEFPNVVEMDNFWSHTLVLVSHYYSENDHKDSNVYNYNDHCWFQVVRVGSEQTLGDTYERMGLKWYLIAGSMSYIDQLVPSMIRGKKLYFVQSEVVKFPENYYVVVIGDFIFETALPKYVFDMMKSVYNRVQSVTDPALQSIEELIRLPAKTTLTISRDANRAEEIRSKIKAKFQSKN